MDTDRWLMVPDLLVGAGVFFGFRIAIQDETASNEAEDAGESQGDYWMANRHVLEWYVNHLVSVEYNETLVYSRFLIDTLANSRRVRLLPNIHRPLQIRVSFSRRQDDTSLASK